MDASGYKSLFLGLLMVPVLGMEGRKSRRSWKGRGPVVVWKDDGREGWGCWHHNRSNPTIPLLLYQEATAAANASGHPSDTQETTERNLRALLPRQCHVKCQGFSSIKLDPSRKVWEPLPCLSFLAGDFTSVEHSIDSTAIANAIMALNLFSVVRVVAALILVQGIGYYYQNWAFKLI